MRRVWWLVAILVALLVVLPVPHCDPECNYPEPFLPFLFALIPVTAVAFAVALTGSLLGLVRRRRDRRARAR